MILVRNVFSFKSRLKVIKNVIRSKSEFFITTPIFYVNADPHIGHLYTALIADASTRYQKLKYPQNTIKFLTGTDEHGLKIYKASVQSNITPLEFCDKISARYKSLFELYNIAYDDYVRTTEERHKVAVKHFWETLSRKGFIYRGEYSGWYCIADEAFIPEAQLEPEVRTDGKRYTVEGGKVVEFVKEENYKFKLSLFKDDLLKWLNNDVVKPPKFQKILLDWIHEGTALNDISVSRPASRVCWGIPVPYDSSQVIYVWLDALVNYLTSCNYPGKMAAWPPDVQVIGKDILKFHGIFWPAFLLAAGLELPKTLLCHSHWVINNEKMSKSKGNVVDPFEKAKSYTCDGFRYFLLREGVPHSDGNYSEEKIMRILNSELADTLGNLLNRCSAATLNARQVFPSFSADYEKYFYGECEELMQQLDRLPGIVDKHYSEFNFYKGIDAIIATLHLTNKLFDARKPWELKKDVSKRDHLDAVLHMSMESLRVCGILLQPIMPNLTSNLLHKIGIPTSERCLKYLKPLSWENNREDIKLSSEKIVLFQRLSANKI